MLKQIVSFVLAGHCRLTISAAFTGVPCLIRHGVNLKGSTYGVGTEQLRLTLGGRVKKDYASPLRHWAFKGHGPFSISRASTDVTLLILRVADLAAALPVERARPGAQGLGR